MDLLQLRYFQQIAKYQSVTKAAQHCNIPQPAMSQTLARLERDLGNVKLFDRTNNRMVLNSNGKLFLQYVNNSIQFLDNGISAISGQQDTVSGDIYLLVLENRRFITNCVLDFAKQFPDVNFHISHDFYGDTLFPYDLCISSNLSFFSQQNCVPLIQEDIVLNVHQSHPLATQKQVALTDLKGEKFITTSPRSDLHRIVTSACHAAGFEAHISFVLDDPYYVRKYVSENMGVALAPALSWCGRFRTNTVLLSVENPKLHSTSYLIWDDQRWQSNAVTAFRAFLLQKAKELNDQ